MPSIELRPNAAAKIHRKCGITRDYDLAVHIGQHPSQVSRVLSGKHLPGNKFIAGVVHHCGLKFAFDHVFTIVDETQ
jgi:hypothetical protein